MTKFLSIATVILGGAAAAFADMPYSWAHIAAAGLAATIAGLHGTNAATSLTQKGNNQ